MNKPRSEGEVPASLPGWDPDGWAEPLPDSAEPSSASVLGEEEADNTERTWVGDGLRTPRA